MQMPEERKQGKEKGAAHGIGVSLTAIVSIAAVLVSLSQVWVAFINKEREMALQQEQQEREWDFRTVKFITDNADVLFGEDSEKQQRLRDVMLVAFPGKVTEALFQRLEETATSTDELRLWRESREAAAEMAAVQMIQQQAIPTTPVQRVFLHYANSQDRELMAGLTERLRAEGFRVPGMELVRSNFRSDIRFYHPEDEETAQRILELVAGHLADSGRPQEIQIHYLGERYSNVPQGVVEVWLSTP